MSNTKERLRRSVLVSSGFSRRQLEKGAASEADVVWLELEDGVHPGQKEDARLTAAAALNEIDWRGKERVVRVNPVDSPWFEDDMQVIVPAKPDAIIVAKARTADDIKYADSLITKFGGEPAGDEPGIQLGSMIETPQALYNIREIATASPRMAGLWFGAADFSYEMQYANIDLGSRGKIASAEGLQPELLFARTTIVLTARALGLYAIDVGFTGHRDLESCYRDALWTFRLGFDGKMCISPPQIAHVNRAYAPTPEMVEWARSGLKLNDEMNDTGIAVATLNEYAIFDGPFVKQARRILDRARLYDEATDG